MATYYVGIDGNDSNDGLSWANRKATLNGAEDIPVAAGDTVWVGPGVYREELTEDVSGADGSPITYIGDVTGEHTDGIGGPVRISGSNDDQSVSRASCITGGGVARSYRTYRGLIFESVSGAHYLTAVGGASSGRIVEDCIFLYGSSTAPAIQLNGSGTGNVVRRCLFATGGTGIQFIHTSTVSDAGHVVENCIFAAQGNQMAVRVDRVGGITVRNCTFLSSGNAVRVQTALAAGQTVTVHNCIISGSNAALVATATGELVEDYNNLFGNPSARSNVAVGTNSTAYPPLFTPPLLHAGIRMPCPLPGSLLESSKLHAIAGSGEATDDLYGTVRPSTSAKRSRGAVQFGPGQRETGTVRTGVASIRLADAGRHQMFVPASAESTTISVYVQWQTDYSGTKPQLVVRQPGQADQVDTAAGDGSIWEELSVTLIPAAVPPYVVAELVSNNEATSGDFAVYFDDLSVS